MKNCLNLFFFTVLFSANAQEWENTVFLDLYFGSPIHQLKIVSDDNFIISCPGHDLLRWDGVQWNDIGGFNSVAVPYFHYLADDDIYATKNNFSNGDTHTNYNYIAHWNGIEWSNAHNLNVAKPIAKIHVIDNNEIYAVGEFNLPGIGGKVVAKYSNEQWTAVGYETPGYSSYSSYSNLWVNNGNDIYTTSGGSDEGDVIKIKHWDGENWRVYRNNQLDEVERLSQAVPGTNGTVYAFGFERGTSKSCIARWNGQYWEVLGNIRQELNTHYTLENAGLSIEYINENEIYAIGRKLKDASTGKFKVAKWNGENWSEVGHLNGNLEALSSDINNGYLYVAGDFTELAPSGNYRSVIKRLYIGVFEINAKVYPSIGGAIYGQGRYHDNDQVVLDANANEGYTFLNWTEDGTIVSDDVQYQFTVNQDRNLVANFILNNHTVNTTANPTNGGTTSGNGNFDFGTTTSVSATSNEGYTFLNWTENENIVSDDVQYQFTVNQDRNLVANFILNNHTVNTTANPTNGGTTSGNGNFDFGTTTSVSATSNEGYTFLNWTENENIVSDDVQYQFTVNQDRNLVANFILNNHTVNTTANPTNGGTTSGNGNFDFGTTTSVSATSNEGYTFLNWTENENIVSDDVQYQFTVNQDRNLVANFEPKMSVSDWNSEKINVYPNPFKDFIILKTNNAIIEKIELFDLTGKVIISNQINQLKEYKFDTKGIPQGNYLLKIYTKKTNKVFKIIKN